MNDRQRIVLGLIMIIAVAGAGILSLIYTRHGADVSADTLSSSEEVLASGAYIKLDDGLEAYINNENSCIEPGESTIWRVYVKNGSTQARNVTLQIIGTGIYGMSVPEGAEEWISKDNQLSTRITLGKLGVNQVAETMLTGKSKAPQATMVVKIDDGSGIVFPGEISKTLTVSDDCQI